MTTDFATLHRQVVFGEAGDKILWQPRILAWYKDKIFFGEPFPHPFTGMNLYEIYRELGCSHRLYDEYNSCLIRIEDPRVEIVTRQLNEPDTMTIIKTPVGKQIKVERRVPSSWWGMEIKREVETEEELKVAAWRETHTTWAFDWDRFNELQATVGDLGAPTIYMPRMNVQSLYIEKMGVEAGVYAILDWTDTVEAYFAALEVSHNRLIDVLNESPIDIINFGENVHAHTLPPAWFEKYHLPACQRRCERLHAAGKFCHSHWDGDTGPLLKYAKETGLDGIEAITPQPQGDVTLEQVKEALGDDVFLLDGIPAVYFDEVYSEQTLIECTKKVVDLFAPKLVLGISDEISSTGDLERVRLVGEVVDAL